MNVWSVLLIISCRCKNKDEINVRQNQGVSLICGKCSNTCMVVFRSAIVHQFSAVLGYLDLNGCHAFDLVLSESDFMVGCEKCNKEMKVQVGNTKQSTNCFVSFSTEENFLYILPLLL